MNTGLTIILVLAAAVAILYMRKGGGGCCGGGHEHGGDGHVGHGHGGQDAESKAEMDPVCGMDVKVDESTPRHDHGGKTYYFCSENCLRKFKNDPKSFLGQAQTGGKGCCH